MNNAIEIFGLIEFRNGNPNGDPDNDNQPRQDHDGYGFITSAALKRKVRDAVAEIYGKELFICKGEALNTKIQGSILEATGKDVTVEEAPDDSAEEGEKTSGKKRGKGKGKTSAVELSKDDVDTAQAGMLQKFWDLRAFGGVLGTGKLPGGARLANAAGPVQFEEAWSVHPLQAACLSITRCVGTTPDKEQTMGRRWVVPYGLYAFRATVSPHRAGKTGFSEEDLNMLLEALQRMCDLDTSAARPYSALRYLNVFVHEGSMFRTRLPDGRSVYDLVNVELREGVDTPRSYEDFMVTFDRDALPESVRSAEAVAYTSPQELLRTKLRVA